MKNRIMKKLFTISIILFFVGYISAQNKSVVSMVGQSADYIELIEQKYNKQIVHLEYDVIKTSTEVYRQLFKDVQYGIIIFGDESVKDINLKISRIINNSWQTEIDNKTPESMVMLFFTPKETDLYKFDISAVLNEQDDFAIYNFILFR